MMRRSKNYSSQLQKHHHQQQRISLTFLPMMCSSSSAVKEPSHRRGRLSSEEPSSPRVGCMGQVKRTNKVVAFPSSLLLFKHSDHNYCSSKALSSNNSTTSIVNVKYHKLKRFFSAKSLITSPISTAARATAAGTHKPRIVNGRNVTVSNNNGAKEAYGVVDHKKGKILLCRSKKIENTEKASLVNLEELDPPLPVVKRAAKEEEGGKKEENMSLWKRRSGGAPLKTLQVQVIHPNRTPLPANTV